jgi:hypothetical protein
VPLPRLTFGLTLAATVGLAMGAATALPVADAAAPSGPVAQYLAFANAVNLKPGDVPGFAAKPKEAKRHRSTHRTLENQAQYQRCVGIGKETKPLLQASSDDFNSGQGLRIDSASSQVQIMPTSAIVLQELARTEGVLQSPTSRSCLAHLFEKAFGAESKTIRRNGTSIRIRISGVQLVPLQLGSLISGTEGGFGMNFSMNVTYIVSARGRHATLPVSLSFDILAFAVGRAEVNFTATSISEKFPRELEGKLLSLMVSRALTASHEYPAVLE